MTTANALTISRLVLSPSLLFLPLFSAPFTAAYLYCGMSDMADGYIARKTHTESETGAKLDSMADLVFAAICTLRVLPHMHLDAWLWLWIALIALIKTANIASVLAREKSFSMPHTMANKITGALLFALPLTMPFADIRYTAIPVCAVASFAAIQERYK